MSPPTVPDSHGDAPLCCRLDRSRPRSGQSVVRRSEGSREQVGFARAHPGRRSGAGGCLPADRVQRGQQPRPPARGHPGARAAGDRRSRLRAQPGRAQPAHPRLPPDRAADEPGPGVHGQRRHGPLRALPGRDLARGRLPRAALRRRCPGPAHRLRRPAPLHRRRRLRGHRHLPRQPAGRLAEGAAGAVRGVRPALGTTPARPTPGSTSTAPPAPRSPPTTCSTRATSASPGSAGARTSGSARTAGPAGAGR